MSRAWEAVIGLEIHAQLSTASKLFSGAATAYGAEPNTQASFVDGLPVGLQLIGPAFAEARLLAAAHGLQQVTDWHTRTPGARP